MGEALLIVDVQNDFLPGGALGVIGGDRIVPFINKLQKRYACVVASKDWHPPGHCSFIDSHPKTGIWPPHCVQGTMGAEFAPSLETERLAAIFYKGVDLDIEGYSAFFDNEHRRSTGLAEWLRQHNVDTIAIVGLATDYCVKCSALDARREGFEVEVYREGCAGIDCRAGDSARAIDEMRRAGVVVK